MAAAGTQHFRTLDALRGVAAIGVAVMHASKIGSLPLLPSAYLAVDLFFMLSGFVLAHAYDARLRNGLGVRRFMLQRLVRLYPLYLLGSLVSVALVLAGLDPDWTARGLAQSLVYALAMLPLPPWIDGLDDHFTLYPLNDVAWSLMFELMVNLLFVMVHHRLGLRALALWIGLAGLGLVVASLDAGSLERGWSWAGFAVGAGRVGFGFPVGVLIYRLHVAGRLPAWRLPVWGLVAVLLVLLSMPTMPDSVQMWRDIGVVVLLLPPFIVIAIGSEASPLRSAKLEDWLGQISYPVYTLHGGVLALLFGLWLRQGHPVDTMPLWWRGLALGILLLACAPIARRIDAPLRRWLVNTLK